MYDCLIDSLQKFMFHVSLIDPLYQKGGTIMFFDIYYNSSATQCHGGNRRHLKKGIGAPVWLGELGSFNRQPEQEEGMVLASGGGVSKEEKKTIVRHAATQAT